ncbi:MAG: hypothetical protein ACNA7X_05725, partial [Dehalococcoidia bacterium]
MSSKISLSRDRAYQVLERLRHLVLRAAWYIRNLLLRILRGPAEGWSTFLLLLISVTTAVWSIRMAYSVPTPGLYSLALWSALLGLVLAKLRFRGWLLVTAGALAGLYLSFYWLTSLAEGATLLDRHAEIATRLSAWWQAVVSGHSTDDGLPLSLLLLLVSWAVGFISSWSLFRKHNMWGAVVPGGVAVVGSLIIMLPERSELHLFVYLFAAFLLAARLSALQRTHDWERRDIQYFPRRSKLRAPDGLWFAVVIVLGTALLPVKPTTVDPISAAWDTATRPVQIAGLELYRTLGGVPAARTHGAHSFERIQTLGSGIALRETPAIIVRAPFAIYLAARSYDVYTSRGWESSDTNLVSPGWVPAYGEET